MVFSLFMEVNVTWVTHPHEARVKADSTFSYHFIKYSKVVIS